jgi:hypothetical protein
VRHLLLLLALSQPAAAATAPSSFWQPTGPPSQFSLQSGATLVALPHGPDTSSGEDVPPGGFKYKKKKKQPVLSYVGGGLGVFGLLYLAGARTAGFEAEEASTAADRDAALKSQSTKKTVGITMLGTAGACLVLDIFI